MSQASFEQDICIDAAPEKVSAFLSTLDNHTQIHPLIIGIQHTQTSTAPDGTAINHYTVRDRMKQGPFLMTFSYRVEMSINVQGVIVYDAHQFPRIYLHNTMQCLPEGSGTRLKERVEITAPGLLMKTVYTQALSSHKEMFEKLKEILQ
ncbi:MAG TPA: SRPBCC family protein [Ktedonobacteraceae bacterium]|nr:SRPBCC family protein [Ktedonobacteraceae bacterium]